MVRSILVEMTERRHECRPTILTNERHSPSREDLTNSPPTDVPGSLFSSLSQQRHRLTHEASESAPRHCTALPSKGDLSMSSSPLVSSVG